jgi:hypothetical protein
MSGGAGEHKHEVRDGSCPRVQNTKAAGIQAELHNEEGVMRTGMPMMSDRKQAMMWLVAAVRGPFQLVQSGGGSSLS